MWAATLNVMLIIEPGTTPGYLRIKEIRERFIAQGAHILAPCPHENACPIVLPDWCHFVQRVQRTKDHMIAKGGTVPFEDEKFAYLAIAREKPAARPAQVRILLHPNSSKAGLHMKVCSAQGIREITVPKREKKHYAVARRLDWGDALIENPDDIATDVGRE
jgi:ribosomal protein RSM22 (predicted rRNA methylase)